MWSKPPSANSLCTRRMRSLALWRYTTLSHDVPALQEARTSQELRQAAAHLPEDHLCREQLERIHSPMLLPDSAKGGLANTSVQSCWPSSLQVASRRNWALFATDSKENFVAATYGPVPAELLAMPDFSRRRRACCSRGGGFHFRPGHPSDRLSRATSQENFGVRTVGAGFWLPTGTSPRTRSKGTPRRQTSTRAERQSG